MGKVITGVRRFVGLDVHAETIAAAIAEKHKCSSRAGDNPQSGGEHSKAREETQRGRRVDGLLRGRADGLRAVLATDADWGSPAW